MAQALIGNLVAVWFCASAWVHIQPMLQGRRSLASRLVFAVVMGVGVVATMALADRTETGFRFDLRSAVVVVSGFLGGPFAALVTTALAMLYRFAVAGPGQIAGIVGLGIAGCIGVVGYYSVGSERPSLLTILSLSIATGFLPLLALATVDADTARSALQSEGLMIFVVNTGATTLATLALLAAERRSDEQRLLEAAVAQSPDYLYVKDLRSRFVAVNNNVARYNGFKNPEAMVGLTDFDISPARRARDLFFAEQRMLRLAEPDEDREERVSEEGNAARWFVTSKVPVRDGDGVLIGLAGVTRDVTQQRLLEKSLADSRDQLSYVLSEVADGIAMFDPEGCLVFCNEQYRGFFPLTAAMRNPGVRFLDILRFEAETGEVAARSSEPPGRLTAGEREIKLFNGRWLHIVTRVTSEGTALVVVSDISTMKAAEEALRSMTEQLRLLAGTDGLTGLPNRRAFDQAIEAAMARDATGELSLLMVDVDRFKNFNDIYGHPAGDECLRAVAACLREAATRPSDLVARYGGEEFVALLANTGPNGAYRVAERCCETVRQLKLQHEGSERKIVTASIGVATMSLADPDATAAELVKKADEALYHAKGSGRDRVVQWHRPVPMLPAASSRAS